MAELHLKTAVRSSKKKLRKKKLAGERTGDKNKLRQRLKYRTCRVTEAARRGIGTYSSRKSEIILFVPTNSRMIRLTEYHENWMRVARLCSCLAMLSI